MHVLILLMHCYNYIQIYTDDNNIITLSFFGIKMSIYNNQNNLTMSKNGEVVCVAACTYIRV